MLQRPAMLLDRPPFRPPRQPLALLLLGLIAVLTACGAQSVHASSSASEPAPELAADDGYGYSFASEGEGMVTQNARVAPPMPSPAPGAGAPWGDAAPSEEPPTPPSVSPPPVTSPQGVPAPAAKLLIYRARITLAVFEVAKSLTAIQSLATRLEGYLVHRSDREITIRVPAARFEEALQWASKTGDELHREVEVDDVSERYYDLLVHLRNAEAMAERLRALLARAESVKDALAVEEQLGRVTATLESLKGQLKRLSELVAYSTITVEYQAREGEDVDSEFNLPFPWLRQLGLPHLLNLEAP